MLPQNLTRYKLFFYARRLFLFKVVVRRCVNTRYWATRVEQLTMCTKNVFTALRKNRANNQFRLFINPIYPVFQLGYIHNNAHVMSFSDLKV